MLTLYRRHSAECPKRADRYWKRCTCAMWVEGIAHDGHYIRRSLKTSSWERAQGKVLEMEAHGPERPESRRIPVEQAIREYLADAEARGVKATSMRHLRAFYERQFGDWCAREGLKFINEVDSSALRRLRE